MANPHRTLVVGPVLAGLGLAACTTELTAPAASDPDETAPPSPAPLRFGETTGTPWVCYSTSRLGDAKPAIYRHKRFWAAIPDHIVEAARGETQTYRLTARTEDGGLWGQLNCEIPAGEAARRFIHELMSVGTLFPLRGGDKAGPTATVCSNGVCTIPGIVVTVPQGYGGYLYPDFQYSPSYIPDSGSDYDSHDPIPCDPQDPEHCEDVLSPEDVALINDAFDHLRREFTDEDDAEACEAMAERFQSMMDEGRVFRGAYNTGVPGQPDWHWGAHNPQTGHIHIDPWVISAVADDPSPANLRQLLGTALHEGAHDLYWDPNSHQYSNDHDPAMYRHPVLNWDIYGEAPWSHLNPGAQSCVSW